MKPTIRAREGASLSARTTKPHYTRNRLVTPRSEQEGIAALDTRRQRVQDYVLDLAENHGIQELEFLSRRSAMPMQRKHVTSRPVCCCEVPNGVYGRRKITD